MLITSLQNPRVKHVIKLSKRRYRDTHQMSVVEGVREVTLALANGFIPTTAFVCRELVKGDAGETAVSQLAQLPQTELFDVTTAVFAKMAYRGQSGGLLLVIPYQAHTLADVPLNDVPFVAIIDNLEKPGNLGAILRTADAAGVDALIITGEQGTDIHNPNAIRASLGAFFTVPVVQATTAAVMAWLQQQAIQVVAATPDGRNPYTAVDLTGPTALLTGSEAHGLSQRWLAGANVHVCIPMYGTVDSLNLATATALLLYEVVRQRQTRRE